MRFNWKRRLTILLCVRRNVFFCSVVSYSMCAKSRNSMCIRKDHFEQIDIFGCAGRRFFFTPAQLIEWAKVFLFDWIFCLVLSSMTTAKITLLKLASVVKTSAVPGSGCLIAKSQALLSVFFAEPFFLIFI